MTLLLLRVALRASNLLPWGPELMLLGWSGSPEGSLDISFWKDSMLSGPDPPLQGLFVWVEHLDKIITNRKRVFLSIETINVLRLQISKLGEGLWPFRSLHWSLLPVVVVLDSSSCSHERSRAHRGSLLLSPPPAGPGAHPLGKLGSFQYVV